MVTKADILSNFKADKCPNGDEPNEDKKTFKDRLECYMTALHCLEARKDNLVYPCGKALKLLE